MSERKVFWGGVYTNEMILKMIPLLNILPLMYHEKYLNLLFNIAYTQGQCLA